MKESVVLDCLLEIHREIESDVGEDPTKVAADVQPLDALGGFDSPLIPNVIRGLARKVGISLPKGKRLLNPYVDSDRKKLNLRGVARRFCELYGKEA